MMSEKDEHFCIVCKETIQGLMNYVSHRKTGCQDQRLSDDACLDIKPVVFQETVKDHDTIEGTLLDNNSQPHEVSISPVESCQPDNEFIDKIKQSDTPNTSLNSVDDNNHGSQQVYNNLWPKYSEDIDMNDDENVDDDVDESNDLIVSKDANFSVTYDKTTDLLKDNELITTGEAKEYGLLSAVIEDSGQTIFTGIKDFPKKNKRRKGNKVSDNHMIKVEMLQKVSQETDAVGKHSNQLNHDGNDLKEEVSDECMEKKEEPVCDIHVDGISSSLTCSVCQEMFQNGCSFLEHLLTGGKKESDSTCNDHDDLLMKYLSSITRQSPFQCEICQFFFNSLKDFENHLQLTDHIRKTKDVHFDIKCEQCDMRFRLYRDFEKHIEDSKHNSGKLIRYSNKVDAIPFEGKNIMKTDMTNSVNTMENILDVQEATLSMTEEETDTGIISQRINEFKTDKKTDPKNGVDVFTKVDEVCSDKDGHSVGLNDGSTALRTSRKRAKVQVDKRTCRNRMIECKHCAFTCNNIADMKLHYVDKHDSLTSKCDVCDVVFLNNGILRRHSNSKEHQARIEKQNQTTSSAELFQCHVCNMKFASESYCKFHTAYQHFHINSEESLLKYPSVTRDKYADFLISIAHEVTKTKCKCPECGLTVNKGSMMPHLRLHSGEQPFQCKLCDERFASVSSLRRHLAVVHFDVYSKSCEICGEHFNRVDEYSNHISIHKAKVVESKVHICEVCGASFHLSKQLRSHLYKHQQKTLKCDFTDCQWTFHNKHDLKMHKLTHSSDEKAFICSTCGFTAKCRKYLKAHEKIHLKDVELLPCKFCEYKCRKTTHMRRHLRIHFGSKPYKCPYCSYACNTHDNIRKHILETTLHEGMKVYPCKFCEYSTNSTKEFRSHLLKDHSEHVGEGASFKSLSSFTGLFVASEDLSVPEEGMEIIPVNKRKNSRRSFQPEQETVELKYE